MKDFRVSSPGKAILFGEHGVVHGTMAIATAVGKVTVGTFKWDNQIHSNVREGESKHEIDQKDTNRGGGGTSMSFSNLVITLAGFDVTFTIDAALVRTALGEAVTSGISGGGWGTGSKAADIPTSLRKAADRVLDATVKRKETPCLKVTAKRASSALVALFLALVLRRDGATCSTVGARSPIYMSVDTDLPIGAGLGSSASFAVTSAAGLLALLDMWACEAPGRKRPRSPSPCATCCEALQGQRQQCKAQLDLINDWAYQVERILHGTPSGIDNATITYGGFLTMEKRVFKPVAAVPPLDFLIVDTMVPDRSTARLVASVHALLAANPATGKALIAAIDAITREAVDVLAHHTGTALHDHLVDLIRANQGTLDGLGVGHERITEALSIARAQGLTGKLTGAGGGGCVLILIPSSIPQAGAAEKCMRELTAKGFTVFRTKLGAPGVMVEQVPEK